jgi:hypothetical protein
MAPIAGGGFVISLSRNNTVLVSDSDIQYFNASSHEFRLTSECQARLEPLGWRLSGDFKITIGGEQVLTGVVVPPIVSRSYDANQVVLLYPAHDMDYSTMKLQMGYPWDLSLALSSINPLDNALLASHFRNVGKLFR